MENNSNRWRRRKTPENVYQNQTTNDDFSDGYLPRSPLSRWIKINEYIRQRLIHGTHGVGDTNPIKGVQLKMINFIPVRCSPSLKTGYCPFTSLYHLAIGCAQCPERLPPPPLEKCNSDYGVHPQNMYHRFHNILRPKIINNKKKVCKSIQYGIKPERHRVMSSADAIMNWQIRATTTTMTTNDATVVDSKNQMGNAHNDTTHKHAQEMEKEINAFDARRATRKFYSF